MAKIAGVENWRWLGGWILAIVLLGLVLYYGVERLDQEAIYASNP